MLFKQGEKFHSAQATIAGSSALKPQASGRLSKNGIAATGLRAASDQGSTDRRVLRQRHEATGGSAALDGGVGQVSSFIVAMAATDLEKRELVTKADSDLQFVLGEAGLSLDAQYRVVQRHTTLRRFQAIADTRGEARASGKTDFGLDDGNPEGRQQIAGIVAAWELARDVITKETETRAEAKVLGQPRILQVTERQAMLKAVAAVHGHLGESETRSAEYLALKCEECESNEPQASTLDAVTSKRTPSPRAYNLLLMHRGGYISRSTNQRVSFRLPPKLIARSCVWRLSLGCAWLPASSRSSGFKTSSSQTSSSLSTTSSARKWPSSRYRPHISPLTFLRSRRLGMLFLHTSIGSARRPFAW